MTDVDAAERAAVAALDPAPHQAACRSRERPDAAWFVSHGGDKFEHLTQAGTGRLNPQALEGMWLTPDGEDAFVATPHPETGEVLARCMFTRQHVGPPGAGARRFGRHIARPRRRLRDGGGRQAGHDRRARPPLQERDAATTSPLIVRARYTHSEGRKHFATGEVYADGVVTVSALGVFISHPHWGASQ